MNDKEIAEIARKEAEETLLKLFRACRINSIDEWLVKLFVEQIIVTAIIETAIAQKEAINKAYRNG